MSELNLDNAEASFRALRFGGDHDAIIASWAAAYGGRLISALRGERAAYDKTRDARDAACGAMAKARDIIVAAGFPAQAWLDDAVRQVLAAMVAERERREKAEQERDVQAMFAAGRLEYLEGIRDTLAEFGHKIELLDRMREPIRKLAADRDAALARVAELEAAIKPYAEYHGGCDHHPDDCTGDYAICQIVKNLNAALSAEASRDAKGGA